MLSWIDPEQSIITILDSDKNSNNPTRFIGRRMTTAQNARLVASLEKRRKALNDISDPDDPIVAVKMKEVEVGFIASLICKIENGPGGLDIENQEIIRDVLLNQMPVNDYNELVSKILTSDAVPDFDAK